MKRKIFSKLLMGAFLIASVSSFVSCKDYDDDINNLQKQIDAAALKAELTTLQTNLAAQIAAAQSAAQAAQAAAEKAQATANNAATKDALEAVKTLATAAGTDAAKAIADAANAQNTADVAKSAATAAQEAAAAAQNVANGASDKAATALADAAKALATAEAASATATAANATASAADATAKEAKATADNAIAAAGNATTQAADAVKAAGEAKAAAEAAKYNDEAVKLLIAQAQASADAAAEDAKEAAEAAAAAVLASASATEDAATAKEAAAKADEAIKEAIANATKAIEEATDAKIKTAVAEAVAKIPTDQSEAVAEQAAAIETLKGNLQTLASAQEKLATAEGLSAAVEELEGKLDATAEAAATAAVAAAAGTIAEAFDALYTAVTSVELVGTFTGKNFNPDADSKTYPLGWDAATMSSAAGFDLNFVFGKMAWTATFGDKETENLDDDAVEKISYTKGADIRAERALLIRVNPTNATFTKDQVKFINSKLETLDDIIVIDEPYRFKGMITRASQESGLWVIPVSVKKDVDFNKFNETTYYKASGDWKYYTADDAKKGQIPSGYEVGNLKVPNYKAKLYAVAINNTVDPEDAAVSRYVASTYDVSATYENYYPATSLDGLFQWTLDNKEKYGTTDKAGSYEFGVTWNNVIHNRWVYNYSETDPGIRSYDQRNAYTAVPEAMEKRWTLWGTNTDEYKAGLVAPTAAEPTKSIEKTVKGAKKYNTENDATDDRFYNDYLTIANVGDPIKVKLTEYLQKKVEYWYISYDFELNAVESKPSEWEAWQSYQDGIEGIYKTVRGDQSIDLIINKSTAQGDVIGFRIWAVNYDGSLVDPDGKAFYVKVGEEPEAKELKIDVDIMAVNATTDMATDYVKDVTDKYTADKDYNVSIIKEITGNDFASLSLYSYLANDYVWLSGNKITNGSVSIYYALLDKDKKVATDWKDVKYIKAGIPGNQLKQWKNGSKLTYSFDGVRNDVNNKERYRITINFTKKMPDDAWTKAHHFDGKIVWKPEAGYDAALNTLTVYAKPYYDKAAVGNYILNPKFIPAAGTNPAEFWWRWNGTTANTLVDFIDDANWLSWTAHEANAGVRNLYDYISKPETSDAFPRELYKFEIKNLPTQLKGQGEPTTKDYVTEWDKAATKSAGDQAVVAVMPKAVREDGTYTTNLKYTYKNISLTWNDQTKAWNTNAAAGDYDWIANATTIQTDFKDALDLVKYTTEVEYLKYEKWRTTELPTVYVVDQTLTKKDANVYIAWKGLNGTFNWSTAFAETQNGATPVFFQLAMDDHTAAVVGESNSQHFVASTYPKDYTICTAPTNDISSFLKPVIGTADWTLAQGALVGTNYTGAGLDDYHFAKAHYQFDNPATGDVDETGTMKIELKGEVARYLKVVTGSTVDNVTLEKISGSASPYDYHHGTIDITGYDVFGKGHTFSIPVVLLYDK